MIHQYFTTRNCFILLCPLLYKHIGIGYSFSCDFTLRQRLPVLTCIYNSLNVNSFGNIQFCLL